MSDYTMPIDPIHPIRPTPPPPPFIMECVVICDQYADFLAKTLPLNKIHFDNMVVVTSWFDHQTARICEHHHIKCIRTFALKTHLKQFCKGAAINEGLAALSLGGWVVHMDADIVLPPQTRQIIQNAQLDPTCLYGIDRMNVRGPGAWEVFVQYPNLQHEANAWIHVDAFPMGTRVMSPDNQGYIPIGFFQLWNPPASGVASYPTEHTTAGRGDMIFAIQWPRAKRHLLPEIVGYHLESQDSRMEANWNGRTTLPFSLIEE